MPPAGTTWRFERWLESPVSSRNRSGSKSDLKSGSLKKELKEALSFLFRKGYLKSGADGVTIASKETFDVKGGVYWAALTRFHKQMFALATSSIENTAASERNLVGFTVALDPERFEAAKRIMDRALEEIEALEGGGTGQSNSVYQFELAAFPLTRREKV